MTAMLKQIARQALGLWPAQALLRARVLRGDPVTVLCYHTLGPDQGGPDAWTALRVADFRAQIALLARNYDIISLDDAVAVGPGRPDRGRPRAVLTFDDGEAGLFTHLLPLLAELRLPVTIYVATAQIETGRPYWFDRVMGALGEGARNIALPGLGHWQIPASPGADRWAVLGDLLEAMKRVDRQQREDLTDRILAENPLPAGRPPLAPLTKAELEALASSPWITIGAHSHCHNLLDQIPLDEAAESMRRSGQLLRDWTGQNVVHFAWPNGNHTEALRRAAADAGFSTATALCGGLWRRGSDPYALPRVAVGRYDDAARLALRLVGI
ncbi:MAG: polysaccharide deacetylase family protein [Paracoccaceae bacterium]